MSALQLSPFRKRTRLEITPESDEEFPGERNDSDLAGSRSAPCEPLLIPEAQSTVGLMAEPPPGDVDREPSHPAVAGSADAKLALGVATLIGRGGKPREGTHFLAILELSPREELQPIGPSCAESNALERVEPSHLVEARIG